MTFLFLVPSCYSKHVNQTKNAWAKGFGDLCRYKYILRYLSLFPSDISASPTANKSKTNENLVNSTRLSTSNCNSIYHPDSNYFPYTGSPKGTAPSLSETRTSAHTCIETRIHTSMYSFSSITVSSLQGEEVFVWRRGRWLESQYKQGKKGGHSPASPFCILSVC